MQRKVEAVPLESNLENSLSDSVQNTDVSYDSVVALVNHDTRHDKT